MNIGILTFHNADNLGAVLQAAALTQYINEELGDAEVIDFVPNNQCGKKKHPIYRLLSSIKQRVFAFKSRNGYERRKKFIEFRNKELRISKRKYYGDKEMELAAGRYDILISGSDQILNTTLSGSSKSFYLCFDDNSKKISYASSFGRTDITNEEKEMIKSELVNFDALSFRESSGQDIVFDLIKNKGELVVDPVFLLDANRWRKKCVIHCDNQKYIFVYAMENTLILKDAILKVKEKHDLPIIMVKGGKELPDVEGVVDYQCGPREFLHYIDNAEYVVTNSFHGIAFSILFGKQFVCVEHSLRNARLENIMNLTNNSEKLYRKISNDADISNMLINGAMAYQLMVPYIEQSRKYLQRNVN